MDQVTNAVTPTAPNGTPDYNYDSVAGLDAPLTYDIDLAQPVGSRILDLAYDGAAGRRRTSSSRWRSTTTGSPAAAASRT